MPSPYPRDSRKGIPTACAIGVFAGILAGLSLPDPFRPFAVAVSFLALLGATLFLLARSRRVDPPSGEDAPDGGIAFLQQLLDSIPDPAFIKDGDHRWLVVNQQACDLFGLPREEIVGRVDPELFPPALARLYMDSDEQAVSSNTLVRTRWRLNRRELRAIHAPDSDEILEGCTHKKPLADRDGRTLVIGIVRDVSEVVASEEDLKRQRDLAQRQATTTGEFLSTLGHEIRNPLQAMLGATEILQAEPLPAAAAESARILHRAGENLLALVNDILELSRLESGATVPREDPVDVAALVTETADLFAPLVSSRGGTLDVVLPDVPVLAFGDEIRIRQILSNLANNAVRYAGHTAIRIELEVERTEGDDRGTVRIAVVDHGPGFDPDEGAELFRKWHRATGNRRGSGLGLAIVQESVQLLGGSVRAEGKVGLGARFSVALPMRFRDEEPKEPGPQDDTREFAVRILRHPDAVPAGTARDFDGLRVLVAEDNRTNQMVMCRQLDKLNCRTTLAQDGRQALDLLGRERYDIVLMDCQMPVMDGFEATRTWRAEEQRRLLARTPILAVTALTLRAEREECLEAGMDEVLSKPLRQADLEAALARWTPKPSHP